MGQRSLKGEKNGGNWNCPCFLPDFFFQMRCVCEMVHSWLEPSKFTGQGHMVKNFEVT